MKLKLTFLALFVFVVAGPIHGQYLHPKVTGKQTQIRNVVMLPAKVEVVRQSMKGPELTKGKTAFTLLVGGLPAYLQLMIRVVDAHTGEVLVFTNPLTRGDATSANDKGLLKAIENSLKKLPD